MPEKLISKLVIHHVAFLKVNNYKECSRTLKAYWSDIYRAFINFPYIFKIGKVSPVTGVWQAQKETGRRNFLLLIRTKKSGKVELEKNMFFVNGIKKVHTRDKLKKPEIHA